MTIVAYKRKVSLRNEFYQGITVKLSKNLVKYHEAFITKNNELLVSHLTDVAEAGSLMSYSIGKGYSLVLNYDKGDTFKKIDVSASNTYHTTVHVQKV